MSHTWLHYSSIIALDLDMNKNKPVALSCEWCSTDPFASVFGFPSKKENNGWFRKKHNWKLIRV